MKNNMDFTDKKKQAYRKLKLSIAVTAVLFTPSYAMADTGSALFGAGTDSTKGEEFDFISTASGTYVTANFDNAASEGSHFSIIKQVAMPYIYGGLSSSKEVKNNFVEVKADLTNTGQLFGGKGTVQSVTENTVLIDGGSSNVKEIFGGNSYYKNVSKNLVKVTADSIFTRENLGLCGGQSTAGSQAVLVEDNTVIISGSSKFANNTEIAGGYIKTTTDLSDNALKNNKIIVSGSADLSNVGIYPAYSQGLNTGREGNILIFDNWNGSSANAKNVKAIAFADQIAFTQVDGDNNPVKVSQILSISGTKYILPSKGSPVTYEDLDENGRRVTKSYTYLTLSSIKDSDVVNKDKSVALLKTEAFQDSLIVATADKISASEDSYCYVLKDSPLKLYGTGKLSLSDDKKTLRFVTNKDNLYSQIRTLTGNSDFSMIGFEASSDIGSAAGKTLTFNGWESSNNEIKSISGFDSIVFTKVNWDNFVKVTGKLDLTDTVIKADNIAFSVASSDAQSIVNNGGTTYLLKSTGTFVKGDESKTSGSGDFTIGTGFKGKGSWKQTEEGIIYTAAKAQPEPTPVPDPEPTPSPVTPLPVVPELSAQEQTHGVLMSASVAPIAVAQSSANYSNAVESIMQNTAANGFQALANISGGAVSQKTGSSVKYNVFSLALGTGYKVHNDNLKAVYGIGLEYTSGSFKNHYNAGEYDDIVNKKGHLKSYGLALSADFNFTGGWHINTALRFGRSVSTLNNALYDSSTNSFYDSYVKTPYYSVMAGGGYEFELSENTKLDIFSSFTYTRISSDDFSADGKYSIDAVNSMVLKAGTKISYSFNDKYKGYSRLSAGHEFDGKGEGSYTALNRTVELTPTETKGTTGYLDVGFICYPNKTEDFSLDFSLSGMLGQIKGVKASFCGKYIF